MAFDCRKASIFIFLFLEWCSTDLVTSGKVCSLWLSKWCRIQVLCGEKHSSVTNQSENSSMDVLVGKRLDFLDSLVGDTNYGKWKSALEREFEKFFSENCPVRSIRTATPLDVKRLMVTKDSRGKTQVHLISCEFLGKVGIFSCNCPLRWASGTVQSILG